MPKNSSNKIKQALLEIESEISRWGMGALAGAPKHTLVRRVGEFGGLEIRWKVYDAIAAEESELSERLLRETIPARVYEVMRERGWIEPPDLTILNITLKLDGTSTKELIPVETESFGGYQVPRGFRERFVKSLEPQILHWRGRSLVFAEETEDSRPSPARKKRGPRANMERHRVIARVVSPFGATWPKHLPEIAELLCQEPTATILTTWEKRIPAVRSWSRAEQEIPEMMLCAIKYSLKMAAKL